MAQNTTTIDYRATGDWDKPACKPVPCLTILYHPNVRRVGHRAFLPSLIEDGIIPISRTGPDFKWSGSNLAEPLNDPGLSRTPFYLKASGTGDIRFVSGDKIAVRLGDRLLEGEHLIRADSLERGVVLVLAGRIVLLLHNLPEDLPPLPEELGMIGQSEAMIRLANEILRVGDQDTPVLIRGLSGTGKELTAQALHRASPRCGEPMVSVNLGALSPELAAAELFGVVKGAYSGADRPRPGFFRQAHGGTLFLDEIGEAAPEIQVKLLRALETGEIFPVGQSVPIKVDVRLIAATDANLEHAIERGDFKAPLLHRLAAYELFIPPLNERVEDMGLLLTHFLKCELEKIGESERLLRRSPWLPAGLAARLFSWHWPGNIRQFRNLVRKLVLVNRGNRSFKTDPVIERLLGQSAIPSEGAEPRRRESTDPALSRRKPRDLSPDELSAILRKHRWDLAAAASELQLPRTSLYYQVNRHPDLRLAKDLDDDEIKDAFQACDGDLAAMVDLLEVSATSLRRRLGEIARS